MVSQPTVESADPLEAIERYFENGWTDGLPVVPPTEAAVRRFVERVGRDPKEVLLTVSETNRRCTVEAAAINAVMAGCRPERLAEVLRLAAAVCAWFHDPDPEDLTRVAARAGALEAALLAFRPESEHGQAL